MEVSSQLKTSAALPPLYRRLDGFHSGSECGGKDENPPSQALYILRYCTIEYLNLLRVFLSKVKHIIWR
jgi:hypothetical protein